MSADEVVAFIVPWDEDKSVKITRVPKHDARAWGEIVFPDGIPEPYYLPLDTKTFLDAGVQAVFDDEGLLRAAPNANVRAMRIWERLHGGHGHVWSQPLVGNFLFLGLNWRTSSSDDLPEEFLDWIRSTPWDGGLIDIEGEQHG